VDRLVVASGSYSSGGYRPGILAGIAEITPEVFAGSPMEADYMRLAPHPEDWPRLIEKLKVLDGTVQDWPPEAIAAIAAPTLVIVGDSDVITLEHAVSLFGLLGGDVAGDIVGLPEDRLAVLPGTTHLGMMGQADLLLAIIGPFLE
jgi:pimeloyl-ACP methyl ester carboxylesterase